MPNQTQASITAASICRFIQMQGWCSSLPFIEETDLLRASHLLGHGLQPNLGQARGYYRGDLVSEFKGMSDDTESREELDLATSQDLLTRCAVVWCGVVCCGVLWCSLLCCAPPQPPPPRGPCPRLQSPCSLLLVPGMCFRTSVRGWYFDFRLPSQRPSRAQVVLYVSWYLALRSLPFPLGIATSVSEPQGNVWL